MNGANKLFIIILCFVYLAGWITTIMGVDNDKQFRIGITLVVGSVFAILVNAFWR